MLLFNCVDQLDADSLEEVWSWDGSDWWLLDSILDSVVISKKKK